MKAVYFAGFLITLTLAAAVRVGPDLNAAVFTTGLVIAATLLLLGMGLHDRLRKIEEALKRKDDSTSAS